MLTPNIGDKNRKKILNQKEKEKAEGKPDKDARETEQQKKRGIFG